MKNPPSTSILRAAAAFGLALSVSIAAIANDTFGLHPSSSDRLVNLRGEWRFTVGDDPRWASPDFDDSGWSEVDAPDAWEDEGYRGYDGYAWYRKDFEMSAKQAKAGAFLHLGRIDDVDEVFVNGERIGGAGRFPPDYETAYDAERSYLMPARLLKAGEGNIVAVRVYDSGSRGGIYSGRLGVYESKLPAMLADLSGEWLFQTGDDLGWAKPDADESGFKPIRAPRRWDEQGYANHDGFAWYRKTFESRDADGEDSMVMLMGKIDDLDEVYLNGKKIGGMGNLAAPEDGSGGDAYSFSRAYHFPASLLRDTNVVAVRVYDTHDNGGIYEGPLGVVSQSQYIEYWERRREDQSVLETLKRLFE